MATDCAYKNKIHSITATSQFCVNTFYNAILVFFEDGVVQRGLYQRGHVLLCGPALLPDAFLKRQAPFQTSFFDLSDEKLVRQAPGSPWFPSLTCETSAESSLLRF